jgi:cysteine desulfurase
VFTSGGTEADNLALTGTVRAALDAGVGSPVIVTSAVEHPAVRETAKAANGWTAPVDRDAVVDLDILKDLIGKAGDALACVSLMLVNNETGTLQPLGDAAEIVEQVTGGGGLVHSDAVQGFAWCDLSREAAEADLVSLSAHKFGGPQGVGALLVRERARRRLRPVLFGGPQEQELRAGTQNVAGAVGMSVAAELTHAEREDARRRCDELGDRLVAALTRMDGVEPAVARKRRVGAICNLRFRGIRAEELLLLLDALGVYASAGSACASGALEPSPVLAAMGVDAGAAKEHVRFSLGYETTVDDVDSAVRIVSAAVERLRT